MLYGWCPANVRLEQSEPAGTTVGTASEENRRWPASAPQPEPGAEGEPETQLDVAAQRQRQIQVFGPILLNPSRDIDAGTRRDAAHELLEMHAPEATRVVDEAIRSKKPLVMLGALQALATAPEQSLAELEGACMAVLVETPPEVLDALAVALGRMSAQCRDKVSAIAMDTSLPEPARLGAIYTLGAFRNRQAAGDLMMLLGERVVSVPPPPRVTTESPRIVEAACASLGRLTGAPLGTNVKQWQRWWKVASDLPLDQWFKAMAESLGDRVTEVESKLAKERETNAALSKQLFDTYRELYPALSVEEQVRRLPRLLDDKSPPVRLFAMSRIALLMRDSVKLGPDVQRKLAEHLDDDTPELRAETVRLLDELGYEGLMGMVAARLETEPSPVAASRMLELAAKRPSEELLGPVRKWIHVPGAVDKASLALWVIVTTQDVSRDDLIAVREDLLRSGEDGCTTEDWRMLALIGDDRDDTALDRCLNGPDASVRGAVAEGLCRRGACAALADRAEDDVVYPWAVKALAAGPPNMATMRSLLDLKPGDEQREIWERCVVELAGRLDAGDLMATDDLLSGTAWAAGTLRRDVLTAGLAGFPADATGERQTELVKRLAEAMIEIGEFTKAQETLATVSSPGAISQLADVRFRAAALCGQFDKAVELRSNPADWMSVLEALPERDRPAAQALCQEIARRFGNELTPDQRQRLDEIRRMLESSAATAAAPGS